MAGNTISDSFGDSIISLATQFVDPKKLIKKLSGIEVTQAKAQRCYLICIGTLVGFCFSPMAALCIGGSVMGAYYLIKDYEDTKEVESMRKKALNSDFFAIISDHHAILLHGSLVPLIDAKILTAAELVTKIDEALVKTKGDSILQKVLVQYKAQVSYDRSAWFLQRIRALFP